jgi:uncharacterized membrane protein YkoI
MKYQRIFTAAMVTGLVIVPGVVAAQRDNTAPNIPAPTSTASRMSGDDLLHISRGHIELEDSDDSQKSTHANAPNLANKVSEDDEVYEDNHEEAHRSSMHDDDSDDDMMNEGQSAAVISQFDAIAIAQTYSPNSSVREVELENEHSVLVYSIELSDGTKVDVSASDGSVLRVRNDR